MEHFEYLVRYLLLICYVTLCYCSLNPINSIHSFTTRGGGALPYLTWRDVPLNRVSFYGKNDETGCPFLIKIMRQGITNNKKIMRQGIMWKDTF